MDVILTMKVFTPKDPRLGRHQIHDPRSRAFPMEAGKLPTEPVMHTRHAPIWDQGQVGSCTANAALGMLVTDPLWTAAHSFTEQDCLSLYELETRLDDGRIPGHYPPDDTGSAGIYACKALKQRGLITSYRHAFSVHTVLAMLATKPVAIGIPWFEGMFDPDKDGLVHPTGKVAGGHEVCLDGIDPHTKRVRFANSWSSSWGKSGWGYLTWDDLDALLKDGGDAVTVTL